MKSVLIIGMGLFGRNLASKIISLHNEVMVVDKNADIIDELAPHFTDACAGDCTNETVLRSLGINNFDICFVTIGEDFQASLEITSLLKDLGAKYVVSKAERDIHAKFLLRNGADEIVCPDKEVAEKLAMRHSAQHIYDYIDISPEFSICEVPILKHWPGKSIGTLDIRKKHHINVIAIENNDHVTQQMPGPDYIFQEKDLIVITGNPSDISRFTAKV